MKSPERDFWSALLRLDEERVLVEQLKLIYASVNLSIAPMIPAMGLLVYMLNNGQNLGSLLLWFFGLGANNLVLMWEAHRRLKAGIAPGQAPRLVLRLMLCIAVGGLAWGLLAWGALGNASLGGNVLVIGVLAGVLGGAVSLLSPVPVVFAVLAVTLAGTTVLRLWQLDDPAFNAFGVISLMYIGVLIWQCKSASSTVRAMILLRFENLELVQAANLAQEQAVQANLAKSKFLAAASHDLRQPIHAQGLFLEVMANTPLNTQQTQLLDNLRQSRDSTAQMLDVLLDFSRIEAGVVQPNLQVFRLMPLINKLEREFAPQAEGKGLDYRSRETSLVLESDPALVELALRNLIANAIRYTDSGGLLVSARRRAGRALIEVRDTGIGIAPEQQADVFKEFHQLANPERDSTKGFGLGLAIAQGLARELGGTLTLKSRLGKGSCFALSLSLAQSQTTAPILPSTAAAQAGHGLHAQLHGLHGLRILLLDDNASIRLGMQQLLESWGCVCHACGSMDEALDAAEGFAPQVAICDYRLQHQQTGAQAINALRDRLGRPLPCLLITGDTAPERLREAVDSGAPLLHKPVSADQLRKALVHLSGPPRP